MGVIKTTPRPNRDQWFVLFRSAIAVCYVRVSLWIKPFGRVLQSVERLGTRRLIKPNQARFSPGQYAWAVEAIAKRVLPDGPCLTQALALLLLLRRRGYPAELRIGVRPSQEQRLDAHAWIESEGQILIGRTADLSEYTPLPRLEDYGQRRHR